MPNTTLPTPLMFLTELTKDILDPHLDPMQRHTIVEGYAAILELREEAIRKEITE